MEILKVKLLSPHNFPLNKWPAHITSLQQSSLQKSQIQAPLKRDPQHKMIPHSKTRYATRAQALIRKKNIP